jgi:hypothetical protein
VRHRLTPRHDAPGWVNTPGRKGSLALDQAAGSETDVPTLLREARASIVEHVRLRRSEGASAERVVAELRCLVREAESCEEWHDEHDSLMARVVVWALDAYDQDARHRA